MLRIDGNVILLARGNPLRASESDPAQHICGPWAEDIQREDLINIDTFGYVSRSRGRRGESLFCDRQPELKGCRDNCEKLLVLSLPVILF